MHIYKIELSFLVKFINFFNFLFHKGDVEHHLPFQMKFLLK